MQPIPRRRGPLNWLLPDAVWVRSPLICFICAYLNWLSLQPWYLPLPWWVHALNVTPFVTALVLLLFWRAHQIAGLAAWVGRRLRRPDTWSVLLPCGMLLAAGLTHNLGLLYGGVIGALLGMISIAYLALRPTPPQQAKLPKKDKRTQQQVEQRKKTAQLEAGLGLPLLEGPDPCPTCGHPALPLGAIYCPYCRTDLLQVAGGVDEAGETASAPPTPQVTTCPDCGARLPDDALYCTDCGARVRLTGGNPYPADPDLDDLITGRRSLPKGVAPLDQATAGSKKQPKKPTTARYRRLVTGNQSVRIYDLSKECWEAQVASWPRSVTLPKNVLPSAALALDATLNFMELLAKGDFHTAHVITLTTRWTDMHGFITTCETIAQVGGMIGYPPLPDHWLEDIERKTTDLMKRTQPLLGVIKLPTIRYHSVEEAQRREGLPKDIIRSDDRNRGEYLETRAELTAWQGFLTLHEDECSPDCLTRVKAIVALARMRYDRYREQHPGQW